MLIKIVKGDKTESVECPINDYPANTLATIIRIGFRNLPGIDDGQWTINAEDIREDGTIVPASITATVPMVELFEAGLSSMLNDVHAGITEKEFPDANKRWEMVMAAVGKKMVALANGTVKAGGGGRAGDPITARAMKIARTKATAQLKAANGGKAKGITAKAVTAKAKALVKENPAYMHLAESQIRAEIEAGVYDPTDDFAVDDESDDDAAAA